MDKGVFYFTQISQAKTPHGVLRVQLLDIENLKLILVGQRMSH